MSLFQDTFKGLDALVTGHTGFKGSWLSVWLNELGARVIGYSLEPPTKPNNFQLSNLENRVIDVRGDIRDLEKFQGVIEKYHPQVIFHLVAQPIVLKSFDNPKETMDVNVGGTVNVLEAVRKNKSTKALVCITSDKCYADQEWNWGYRENDILGGSDPYSASKGMAELAIASYRKSFFLKNNIPVSSSRAGNVIGGGDFSDFRLLPDCMRSLINNKPIEIRNPNSSRPWQFVLEPLSGYLLLSAKMLQYREKFAEAWNFGPIENKGVTALDVAKRCIKLWGDGSCINSEQYLEKREAEMLKIHWDKAASRLNWRPVYKLDEALQQTVEWFKTYALKTTENSLFDMYQICAKEVWRYTERAREQGIEWSV